MNMETREKPFRTYLDFRRFMEGFCHGLDCTQTDYFVPFIETRHLFIYVNEVGLI